ncbi:MAG: hypothetical protein EOL90_00105 [Spartobacteria bacterium]|nr:hypothetical protein [Spartobacteria bacterium]
MSVRVIQVETAVLGTGRPGDTFTLGGHLYRVREVQSYFNEREQHRIAVEVEAECQVCGKPYTYTTHRRPTYIPKTCKAHRWQGPRKAGGEE